jgi:hypothetical protein
MALKTGGWGLLRINDIGVAPSSDFKMQAAGSVTSLADQVHPFIITGWNLMTTMHCVLEFLDNVRMAHSAGLLSNKVGPPDQLLSSGDVHS